MRLTMQDKNQFLKAALKATDLGGLKQWVIGIIDAIYLAEAASGKAHVHVAVPPYVAPTALPKALGVAQDVAVAREQWQNGALLT